MNDHAGHDPVLVARAAGGEALAAGEAVELAGRLADCADCRALHAELLAIAAGLRADLPVPRRTRDFRLAAPEAARARPRGWLARLARLAGALGGSALQPLATAVCTLGLLLVVGGLMLPAAGRPTILSNVGSAVEGALAPPADERSVTAGAPAAPVPGASAASAPSAGATAGPASNTDNQSQVGPPAGPALGLGGSIGAVRPPGSAFGAASPSPGGAGDVAGGISPEATPGASSPAGPDPRAVVSGVGLLLVIVGLGAWLVARHRNVSTG